ncbi:MAG: bifunctional hydroxymethylpyrimidine kinase/phosphomethylpyrimidine kinase [Candidatus Eremiobacteraeota bacterium]|nr:bifunctional hydroxymethylpyrimidine kinase/phosphomethylpyrimidine kinase [Candidatus Eremiobacteraeota bacterium]
MAAIVLSVGTTHPWNVAGTGRDLVVGCDFGVRVFTAVAAVSAQGPHGLTALQPVDAEVFAAQVAALPWDSAAAARIGALPSADAVTVVADALGQHPQLPSVVDPAFAASRGGVLVQEGARLGYRHRLGALPNVILTPNVGEAQELLGGAAIARDSIARAAAALHARGCLAVLLKGGHLEGDPTDALATANGVELLAEARIAGRMHGTGCTLAMAVACEIAAGKPVVEAVLSARAYVRAQIAKH